jgi:arylsulfatase A-like enzyme
VAIVVWAAAPPDKPYFLFLHLWDVHYDYLAPSEYVDLFDPDYEGTLEGIDFMENGAVNPSMPRRDYAHLMALYDAEIRFTDEILGRILKRLASLGRPPPLVVVTADHGEEFFEHGGKGHQRTLFDEVVRVPLVLNWPGFIPPGTVAEEQVGLIDLLPTLAEIAGAQGELDPQGVSLVARLLGKPLPERGLLCELNADGRGFKALRTNQRKLLDYAPDRHAVYELTSDPQEQRPLSWALPQFGRTRAELEQKHSAALRRRIGPERVEVDAHIERQLRELGYLEGGGRSEKDDAPPRDVDGQSR